MDDGRGKFWFVWNPNGRAPSYHHASRQSADEEAKRLAEKNPGHQFIVLKSVGGFEAPRPDVRPIDLDRYAYDNIPF